MSLSFYVTFYERTQAIVISMNFAANIMSPSVEPLPLQNLNDLLAQSLGKDVQVKQLEWRPLTAPGENFGSVMLAINVTVTRSNKTDTLHLVGKLPPTSAYLLDLFNSPVTFKKELRFYSSMAKEFTELQLESGINENDLTYLTPEYFGGRLGLKDSNVFDEQSAIILENLKYNGYNTEDRIWGLDKVHTEFTLERLARLHALVIALKIKKPQLFQRIAEEVLADVYNDATEKCVIDMIKKAQADISDIEQMKPYLDRVNKTIEYGIRAIGNGVGQPEEPWATLVHNDFWVNNMMFRHDQQGRLIDMKIVDFQLCVYDYGVNDLIFFLVSSVKKDVLDNHLNDMIDLYYYSFIKFLKTLQVDTDRFTKKRFDEIVNQCAPIKFNQCVMMVQVIQAPRGTTPDMKDTQGDIFLNRVGDDVCKQKLSQIVQLYDKKGWLIK